jgi:hypothetical protein
MGDLQLEASMPAWNRPNPLAMAVLVTLAERPRTPGHAPQVTRLRFARTVTSNERRPVNDTATRICRTSLRQGF